MLRKHAQSSVKTGASSRRCNPGAYHAASRATAAFDPFRLAFGQDFHGSLLERLRLYTPPLCRLCASLFIRCHLVFSSLLFRLRVVRRRASPPVVKRVRWEQLRFVNHRPATSRFSSASGCAAVAFWMPPFSAPLNAYVDVAALFMLHLPQ